MSAGDGTGPRPADHAPQPPVPADPRLRAEADIAAAVGALEDARDLSVDDRLVAAERAHEVLAAHLAGRAPQLPGVTR